MSPVPFARPGTFHAPVTLTFADGSTARAVITAASGTAYSTSLELDLLPELNPPTLSERARAALAVLTGKRGL